MIATLANVLPLPPPVTRMFLPLRLIRSVTFTSLISSRSDRDLEKFLVVLALSTRVDGDCRLDRLTLPKTRLFANMFAAD